MAQKAKTDKASVLKAASDLLSRHGLDGFSIRAVAAALGLAPNAIYYYFESLEVLKMAVASEVCSTLLSRLQRACDKKRPLEGVRALADAYLGFAKEHRHHYEALLLPRPADGEYSIAPGLLWNYVVSTAARVSGPHSAEEAAVALWAALHGLASLDSTDAFTHGKPETSKAFALDAWLEAAKKVAKRKSPARRAE